MHGVPQGEVLGKERALSRDRNKIYTVIHLYVACVSYVGRVRLGYCGLTVLHQPSAPQCLRKLSVVQVITAHGRPVRVLLAAGTHRRPTMRGGG